jgi:hypothetical protein
MYCHAYVCTGIGLYVKTNPSLFFAHRLERELKTKLEIVPTI